LLAALLAVLSAMACSTVPPERGGPGLDAAVLDAGADTGADASADAGDAGPRAVGVITRTFVDPSRPTPANGNQPAHDGRTLVTEIWYPTAGAAAAGPERGATPDLSGGPHPLVLFVHGSSSTRTQSTFLTVQLAAAGLVVAAANFPLTAIDTPGGASDLHADDQVGDLAFLADQLAAASADPADALAGAVDASSYAVVGHSTGGTVALLSAQAPDLFDARVKAVVGLAPCACFFDQSFFSSRPQGRAVPLLVMAGTDDRFVPIGINGQRAFDAWTPPALLGRLIGGDHLQFTDYPLEDAQLDPTPTRSDADLARTLARYGNGSACDVPPPAITDPLMSEADQHTRTLALVRAFLRAQLLADSTELSALQATADPLLVIEQR
jgi:predicted dienelactone hydrolase